jgi:hypothetical protein
MFQKRGFYILPLSLVFKREFHYHLYFSTGGIPPSKFFSRTSLGLRKVLYIDASQVTAPEKFKFVEAFCRSAE